MSGPAAGCGRDLERLGLAAFMLLAAGVIAWDAGDLPDVSGYAGVGPREVPFLVAGGLALLAVATIVQALREAHPEREAIAVGPLGLVFGGLVAQIALLPFAGFSVATGVLFAATARALGSRRLLIDLAAGFGFSLLIYLFFTKVLTLTLPAGPLEALF